MVDELELELRKLATLQCRRLMEALRQGLSVGGKRAAALKASSSDPKTAKEARSLMPRDTVGVRRLIAFGDFSNASRRAL